MKSRNKGIEFVYPTRTAEISVTGKECALRCAHCNGVFLRNIERRNPKSYLVTGGCNREGEVPLAEHLDVIRELAKGHKLIAHTGLIGEGAVEEIAPFVEAVSFNFLCDDDTIRDVYGLRKSAEDYIESYRALRRHTKVYPHITIGLNRGRVAGERGAVEILSSLGAHAVIFNILIPARGTRYANLQPPGVEEVTGIMREAKEKLRDTPIYLGCMRPGGEYREAVDREAVRLEVDRIVMPSRSAVQLAKDSSFPIGSRDECCIL